MANEQQQQLEEEQRQLLLQTLNRLWSHYLHPSDSETVDKQTASVKVCMQLGYQFNVCTCSHYQLHLQEHWLWQLLYHFQYLDEQTLRDAQFNR